MEVQGRSLVHAAQRLSNKGLGGLLGNQQNETFTPESPSDYHHLAALIRWKKRAIEESIDANFKQRESEIKSAPLILRTEEISF